jgi:predicted NAD-dependent protein-ADP-ribosyltransferase YbiA (DUF1768 family)
VKYSVTVSYEEKDKFKEICRQENIPYLWNTKSKTWDIDLPYSIIPEPLKKYRPLEMANDKNNRFLNIYAGTNENSDLSNLAVRPFIYQEKSYNSVEQAFQTLKGGQFHQSTYNHPNFIPKKKADGSKIVGKVFGPLGKSTHTTRESLMRELIKTSFLQNPKAQKRLLETSGYTITHRQDQGPWGEAFPRILMEIRKELSNEKSYYNSNDSNDSNHSNKPILKTTCRLSEPNGP